MSGVFERSYLHLLTHDDRLLVDDAAKCWPWRGGIQSKGYGMVGGRLVHRVVYELVHGPISDGLTIDHLCRNRSCANPSHLEAVTMRENYRRGDGHRGLARRWQRGPRQSPQLAASYRWDETAAPDPLDETADVVIEGS